METILDSSRIKIVNVEYKNIEYDIVDVMFDIELDGVKSGSFSYINGEGVTIKFNSALWKFIESGIDEVIKNIKSTRNWDDLINEHLAKLKSSDEDELYEGRAFFVQEWMEIMLEIYERKCLDKNSRNIHDKDYIAMKAYS